MYVYITYPGKYRQYIPHVVLNAHSSKQKNSIR